MNQGGTKKRQKENEQREQKTGQHGACGTRFLGGWMKQISDEMGGGQGEQSFGHMVQMQALDQWHSRASRCNDEP